MSPERLRELFSYEEATGNLYWKSHRGRVKAGDVVRQSSKGYRTVQIEGKRYQAHRVVWAIAHGAWPSMQIDHVDCDRANNRLSNLREASNSENHQNRKTAKNGSRSGVLGVYKYRDKWRAQIVLNGNAKHLGVFDNKEVAHAAYVLAKRKLHPMGTL